MACIRGMLRDVDVCFLDKFRPGARRRRKSRHEETKGQEHTTRTLENKGRRLDSDFRRIPSKQILPVDNLVVLRVLVSRDALAKLGDVVHSEPTREVFATVAG